MKHLVLVLMLSCVEFSPPFEREEFENEWWEIEEYFDNKIITACSCTLLNIGE